jgi:hypothetical protein
MCTGTTGGEEFFHVMGEVEVEKNEALDELAGDWDCSGEFRATDMGGRRKTQW